MLPFGEIGRASTGKLGRVGADVRFIAGPRLKLCELAWLRTSRC